MLSENKIDRGNKKGIQGIEIDRLPTQEIASKYLQGKSLKISCIGGRKSTRGVEVIWSQKITLRATARSSTPGRINFQRRRWLSDLFITV